VPRAPGKIELVAQVTPNQASQTNQAASEQGEQTGFRKNRGSYNGSCCEGIRSQNQDKKNDRAQGPHAVNAPFWLNNSVRVSANGFPTRHFSPSIQRAGKIAVFLGQIALWARGSEGFPEPKLAAVCTILHKFAHWTAHFGPRAMVWYRVGMGRNP
jgi:hypothetical protein